MNAVSYRLGITYSCGLLRVFANRVSQLLKALLNLNEIVLVVHVGYWQRVVVEWRRAVARSRHHGRLAKFQPESDLVLGLNLMVLSNGFIKSGTIEESVSIARLP